MLDGSGSIEEKKPEKAGVVPNQCAGSSIRKKRGSDHQANKGEGGGNLPEAGARKI